MRKKTNFYIFILGLGLIPIPVTDKSVKSRFFRPSLARIDDGTGVKSMDASSTEKQTKYREG